MRIVAPDPKLPRAKAADWLEICALASGPRGYGYETLRGALNIAEHPGEIIEDDDGKVEDEILETKYEEYCDDLLSELQWRERVLGDLYPFRVLRRGISWRLVPRASKGDKVQIPHLSYTVSLLTAGLGYKFFADGAVDRYKRESARIFQILAHLTSRGLLGGATSFWMGFPRPEHDGFGPALNRFIEGVGVGSVKEEPPVSQQGFNKDAGIDVIAWRRFRDGRPSPLVSYGQVASGQDWQDKAVTAIIDSHFHHWLVDNPVKYYLPAIYIPYMQHENVRRRLKKDFDVVAHDESISLELRLGVVLDRSRLTELAPVATMRGTLDDRSYVQEAARWAASMLRDLRSSSYALAAA